MSQPEVMEFVSSEVEKNPFLEFTGSSHRAYPDLPFVSTGQTSGQDFAHQLEDSVSLRQHLSQQIRSLHRDSEATEAALIIVDELEDDGYLRFDEADLASQHHLSEGKVAEGLRIVQSCDPIGVGARTLMECLRLQLLDLDQLDEPMRRLLSNLHLLANGDRAELARLCGVSAAELSALTSLLRSLDPKPGLKFNSSTVQFTIPDVIILKSDSGALSVELNSAAFPRVAVDRTYARELSSKSPESKAFVSEYMTNADWLVRSLRQRADTIHRVSTDIVFHQIRFFSEGAKALRPLTRRSVADRLTLHETTVGRVTTGKYLSSEQGVLELRSFFSSSIPSVSGVAAFSARAVQERIRNLIDREDSGRPLSDDSIVNFLREDGIDIARRTVAKYRDVMGVPSSQQRRRRNRMK